MQEFLKLTVDTADLIGLYLIIQRVAGKGQVKVLVAGVGWAFAELVLTRVIFLWVGARGIEFDWKYIQNSFDANISLIHYVTLSCLVWLWTRRDIQKSVVPVLIVLGFMCSYKTLILDWIVDSFALGSWTALGYKGLATLSLALVTLQMYVGMTALTDKYWWDLSEWVPEEEVSNSCVLYVALVICYYDLLLKYDDFTHEKNLPFMFYVVSNWYSLTDCCY